MLLIFYPKHIRGLELSSATNTQYSLRLNKYAFVQS
jgi:hypothetical protein